MATNQKDMDKENLLVIKERIATRCICCGKKELKKSPAILMPFVAHRVFDWAPVMIDESWGLNTIKSGMAYSICNSVTCAHCEILFLDIRFSDDELAKLYDGYRDDRYTALRERYEPGYIARNNALVSGNTYIANIEKFLLPFLNLPVRILDWGGDTGKNTPFKIQNKLFHIYDISQKIPIPGAKCIDRDQVGQFEYDLIVCSQVLEHIPYPAEILLDIKKEMKKNTILYIELPYEEIMRNENKKNNLLTQKRHWHEHINFYSEKSLKELLEICGYKILDFNILKIKNDSNLDAFIFQISCSLK